MYTMTESHVLQRAGSDGRSLSYLSRVTHDDLDAVRDALEHISPLQHIDSYEKQHVVSMREVLSTGHNSHMEISMKQLLGLVNSTAANIDAREKERLDDKSFSEYRAKHHLFKYIAAPALRALDPSANPLDHTHPSAAASLLGRDLRRLDFESHPTEEPSVRVRRHAVLFSVDPIRAVIMSSRIILIVPPGGMDQILEIVENYMRGWTKDKRFNHHISVNGHISFESHAFEAILATANTLNSQQFKLINTRAQAVLSYFHTKLVAVLPYAVQEEVRALKTSIFLLQSQVSSLQKALTVLIHDDESMALMNLSKLRANPGLYRFPLSPDILITHEDIEELVESHLIDCNSLLQELTYLLVTIQNAEDLMILKLDTSRNRLLIVNTSMAVYLVAISFSAYLTGVYGMNLDQTVTIQYLVYGVFESVFVTSFALIIIVSCSIMYYLKRNGVLPKEVFTNHKKEK